MRNIKGYSNYLISEDGEIYSMFSNRLLKPVTNTGGYLQVQLKSDLGVSKRLLVHRLVAFVYLNLPSLDSDLEVDHKDNNKLNCKSVNLQVMTDKDHNIKTMLDKGCNLTQNFCLDCGLKIKRTYTRCRKCKDLIKIDLSELEMKVLESSWSKAAKHFNVSDNGLRKIYKRLSGKDPKTLKLKKLRR